MRKSRPLALATTPPPTRSFSVTTTRSTPRGPPLRFLPQLRGVQAKGQAAAVRAKYDAELRRIRAQWSSYGGEKKALQDAFSRRLAELTAARNTAKAGMCADPFGERPMDAATATFYQSEDLKAKIAGSDTVLRDYAGRRSRDLAELEAIKVRMGELQGAWGYSEAFARVRWQQIDAEEIYKNVFEQLVSPDLPEDFDLPLRFHPARTRVSALVVTPFGAV